MIYYSPTCFSCEKAGVLVSLIAKVGVKKKKMVKQPMFCRRHHSLDIVNLTGNVNLAKKVGLPNHKKTSPNKEKINNST